MLHAGAPCRPGAAGDPASQTKKKRNKPMSLKKQYLKSRPVCKVTFRLEKEAVRDAETVHIAGDFNGWQTRQTPMKKLKNGAFTLTLDLPVNREYQFRYFIDQDRWENDGRADKYVPSGVSASENSVVIV
jgi:1,4-alpha-glucan branching enzyme